MMGKRKTPIPRVESEGQRRVNQAHLDQMEMPLECPRCLCNTYVDGNRTVSNREDPGNCECECHEVWRMVNRKPVSP